MAEVKDNVRREQVQSELRKTITTKALRFPCPSLDNPDIRFSTEVYIYDVEPTPAGCIRWVLRWMIAQIGKLEKRRNIIGDSLPTWLNKVEYYSRRYARSAPREHESSWV